MSEEEGGADVEEVRLARTIDGREVYLSVWCPDGPEKDDGTDYDYYVQVSSGPGGAA